MEAAAETTAVAPVDSDMITCAICGAKAHSIQVHLNKGDCTSRMTIEEYTAKFPGQPVLSKKAMARIAEVQAAKEASAKAASDAAGTSGSSKRPITEIFGVSEKAAKASGGSVIHATVLNRSKDDVLIPQVDPYYVYPIELLKTMLIALELNIPVYLWGHAGTGKSTIAEQMCARTNRPMIRVQHTPNMEEEHVIGGVRLRDGKTVFDLGPLPMAMKNGWVYLADEYDFARPEVASLYQAVLEGKPLVIKEADIENRIIAPHPNFRIIATGNTNGQGDETGLYQGTVMQNAANYERFGIVDNVPYMDKKVEASILAAKAGINPDDATKLVKFASDIREEFASAKLSNPISLRSLIYAAKLGVARMSYLYGLEKAYINRLTAVDAESARQFANRVFPS